MSWFNGPFKVSKKQDLNFQSTKHQNKYQLTKIVKMSQTSEMRQTRLTRLTSQMDEKTIKQVNQIKLVNISQFWTIETFVQRGLSVKAYQGYLGKFSMGFEQGSPSLVWTNDLE